MAEHRARRRGAAPAFPGRLRNRIVVRIGALVAGLSIVLGASTYLIVRDALVEEQERSAEEQFRTNTALLAGALRSADVDEIALLTSLRPEVRARELLYTNDQWYAASLQVQPSELPPALIDVVRGGRTAQQRFEADVGLLLALGTPLDDESWYFEVFDLRDLQDTLATLSRALIASGVAATLVGVAVAWWIARRVTGPLEHVADAAARIASGDLDVRMAGTQDRDLGRIAASFNRMADSLQSRIARESRFSADVSHELRSPMTTLVNATTVLRRRRHELSADGREALDLLTGDVERFERIIADLTEMSKHDAGTIRPASETVPVGQLVLDILRRLGRDALPFEVTDAAEHALVHVDPSRLERVFGTVFENADAYAGGPAGVTVDADDHVVVVHLDDPGPGVPAGERERIFERFARGVHGERRTTAEGSGLGLSLAQENMRILDGTVRVEDRPAADGARFTLTLPRVGP